LDIGGDYRTLHNAPMKQLLFALAFCLVTPLSHAWNAAGHRLSAVIAWQQLSTATQERLSQILANHPDRAHWVEKAKSSDEQLIFAEAATWPDDIRNDPRFHNGGHSTPAIPGLPDNARHKNWHYVDLKTDGTVDEGLLDQKIEQLSKTLRSTAPAEQIAYALPWLLHLVGDIHQPLHVGQHGDEGGNQFAIENPFNRRLPFSSLHTYWDDLPGPPWLRGKRLEQKATWLVEQHAAPNQANVRVWRDESHRLLALAYPKTEGSLLPLITEDFHHQAQAIANQRVVEAGYRLGRLLEKIFGAGDSRGTP
jgi:hypothetical protein